jgi:uncharacterized membrane protein YphA (DoxX/SURF4 family)
MKGRRYRTMTRRRGDIPDKESYHKELQHPKTTGAASSSSSAATTRRPQQQQQQQPSGTGGGEGGGEVHFPTTTSEDDDENYNDNDDNYNDDNYNDNVDEDDLPSKPDYMSDECDSAAIADRQHDPKILADEDFVARFRRKCGEAVNHPRMQVLIVALIAINALMMGIGTFGFIKDYPDRERAFELTDRVFLTIFTAELFVQFLYRGPMLVTDGWLVFDLVIIVTSWAFAELQIIRAFRIFRALRLVTRVQVMQNLVIGKAGRRCDSFAHDWRHLSLALSLALSSTNRVLVYCLIFCWSALFGVMPRMVAIGLLLFLVSYIFAVMFTQLFKDLYERGVTDADYFGRLDETFCE